MYSRYTECVLSHFLLVVKMTQLCLERESVYFGFLNNILRRAAMFIREGEGELENWLCYAEYFALKTS